MIKRAKPIIASLVVAVALLAPVACSQGKFSQLDDSSEAKLPLDDCILSSEGYSNQVDALCGTLSVLEDREDIDGRRIDLNVAVVPASNSDVEPDPLFLLAGGPGQAATEAFPGAIFLFDEINEARDLVLVDQRGTGQSNPLDCDPPSDEYDESDEAKGLAWAEACVAELESRADVSLYTTSVAMEDLDEVRQALDYDRINLYGGSYGSRAALEYLRRYPERVRAVIIDSVVPPDLALGTTVARDAQNALDLSFERCALDEDCRFTFPRLEANFATLLAELDKGPKELTVDHPVTGQPTDITLKRDLVAGALRFWSYSPETASLLPLLINDTVESGDYARLAEQMMLVGDASANMLNLGMHFSVVCAEDVPFFDADDVAMHNADTYIADFMSDRLALVCEVWPAGEVPPDLKEPVESDVPVLILSGEADPVTPPAYGEAVAATLSNGLHLVARGQGHGVMLRGCIADLATEFITAGSADDLDTACVDELAAPPFFLNYSGPVPEPPTEESDDD